MKTHFCLVILLIPRLTYIHLPIFFYYMISSITLLLITNIFQVPSVHITFRCYTFKFVLTEDSWRQVLWEIALVDTFSNALSTHCQVVLKAYDNQLSYKLTIAGHLLFSIVTSVNPRQSKKETCKTTEQLLISTLLPLIIDFKITNSPRAYLLGFYS